MPTRLARARAEDCDLDPAFQAVARSAARSTAALSALLADPAASPQVRVLAVGLASPLRADEAISKWLVDHGTVGGWSTSSSAPPTEWVTFLGLMTQQGAGFALDAVASRGGDDDPVFAAVTAAVWSHGDERARANLVAGSSPVIFGVGSWRWAVAPEVAAVDRSPLVRAALAGSFGMAGWADQWWDDALRPMTVPQYRLLRGLLTDPDATVRAAAFANRLHLGYRRLPGKVLADAASRFEGAVWPDPTVDEAAAVRAGAPRWMVPRAGAENQVPMSAEQWRRLLGDTDRGVAAAAAGHPALPEDLRGGAVCDARPWVREAVAASPGLQPEQVQVLATDRRWQVRAAIAQSAPLSAGVVCDLLHDPVERVRRAAAARTMEALAGSRAAYGR